MQSLQTQKDEFFSKMILIYKKGTASNLHVSRDWKKGEHLLGDFQASKECFLLSDRMTDLRRRCAVSIQLAVFIFPLEKSIIFYLFFPPKKRSCVASHLTHLTLCRRLQPNPLIDEVNESNRCAFINNAAVLIWFVLRAKKKKREGGGKNDLTRNVLSWRRRRTSGVCWNTVYTTPMEECASEQNLISCKHYICCSLSFWGNVGAT